MKLNYDYEDQGPGVVVTRLSDNASCFLQGDEGAEFLEQADKCKTNKALNGLCSGYDEVMEAEPDEQPTDSNGNAFSDADPGMGGLS